MSKILKSVFVCANCDAQFPKWTGRCSECGAWGSISESLFDAREEKKEALKKIGGAEVIDLASLPDIALDRMMVGIAEVDRVLGGGLVPGSLVLLGGEPGIGKSTLAAQIAGALSNSRATPGTAVYVSGEESAAQVKSRLLRLGRDFNNLKFISETNIEKIASAALKVKPEVMIIDSIQTVYSALMPSEAGSIGQIRAAAVKLIELSKENGIAVLIIGHITKDGQVAGPKSLEHIVDTVLYLESEAGNNYCLLRATKNRFGSVNELGVLEMTGTGFREAADPGAVFVGDSSGHEAMPGSAIGCVLEGSRPFLVDLQALVSKTVFGYPQRKSSGFDLNRLQVLSAVISKRTNINLVNQDIILNVVGGLKISDPSLDLAACAAVISSYRNKSLDKGIVVIGEVGLGGEVRPVFRLDQRLKEAARLGFKAALIPAAIGRTAVEKEETVSKIKLFKIKDLGALVEIIG